MPPQQHRYEDAVLNGFAVVLLDLPRQLHGAVMALQKLFDNYYPGNGITHVLLNDAPIRSTSGEDVMEYGAVFFNSAKATWAMLDKVEVVLRTEDGSLELRRGYLQLGAQRILMEGVVTWGKDGRERPQPISLSPSGVTSVTQESLPVPSQRTNSDMPESVRGSQAFRGSDDGEEEGNTVVVTLHLKEVYNRHRDVREDSRRTARGEAPSKFPLTPFMVYQALVGECSPRKIVIIDVSYGPQQRMMKALVELENAEVAAHIVRVFTHRAVEFVSERDEATTGGLRARRTDAKAEQGPICAEVRYYINAYHSTRNGQSRFHANGERNYHRTLAVRQQEEQAMSLVDPRNAALLSVKAPREWQHDVHANRVASVQSSESIEREERERSRDRSPGRSAPPSSSSHQHSQHSQHREEKRRRSPLRQDRSGRRSSSRSRSPSPSQSSVTSSATSWQHGQHRRPGESRRDAAARRGGTVRKERGQPGVSGNSAQRAKVDRAPMVVRLPEKKQEVAPVAEQKANVAPAVVQAVPTPAPPTPPRVAKDGLPPGWRPIFSEEYKQTYYAYRDAQTGVETTTWERPQV